MSEKRLVIRADASTDIGTGHVMRCLALCEAWRASGGECVFLSARCSDSLRRRIEESGCVFVPLEWPHPDEADLKSTFDTLMSAGGTLVLDGYHFDVSYQRAIREAGFRLLVIDDYAHLPAYEADVLLNQNVGAEALPYLPTSGSMKLLGPRYALLRSEFRRAACLPRDNRSRVENILVTFGGSDKQNVTQRVLEALDCIGAMGARAHVVIGAANPHREALEHLARKCRMPCELLCDIRNMADLMHGADLAISAGGSTCWELAALGVPFLVVVTAENQQIVADGLQKAGVAVHLGNERDLTPAHIAGAIGRLMESPERRATMRRMGQRLVDGEGAFRVVAALKSLSLTLRPAVENDCLQLWKWANDPVVRQSAFHSEPIPWSEHVRWFSQKLQSDRSAIYLVSDMSDHLLGQIRFDWDEAGVAEVDVSLDAACRGRGWGPALIRAGCARVVAEHPVKQIVARIKAENIASIKAFVRADFDPANTSENDDPSIRVYVWRRP